VRHAFLREQFHEGGTTGEGGRERGAIHFLVGSG
jgi:hypothetical protein